MQNLRKNTLKVNITAIFMILIFMSTGFSEGLSGGRIIPNGKVTLFHGNQKVGEFRSEAPLPEDTLLAVQGDCGVKLRHLFLFAKDNSLFSVTTDANSRTLTVQKGTVYFALSSIPYTLIFKTPNGLLSTSDIILKTSSTVALLKGYVHVEEGITRVGVLEGGSMMVAPDDGKPMMVAAGREIRLAQAEIFKEEGKTEEGKPAETGEAGTTGGAAGGTAASYSTFTTVIIGAAVIGGIAAAIGGGGGGGDAAPASPASP